MIAVHCVELVLVTAALATPVAVFERLRGMDRRTRLEAVGVSVALFALAFAVRWTSSPHTLIHENHHGYDYVATAGVPLHEAALYHDVPSAHRLLVALVNRAFSVDHDPVFALGTALSALGVPGLFWLAARAFDSRRAGLAAASLLLFQPLALFIAPTEEPLNLAVATACAGMALLHLGAAEGSRWSLTAGGALVASAALSRDVTLPLAALAPLALLSARRSPRASPWAPLAACVGLGVVLLPQAVSILGAMRSHPESSGLLSLPHLPLILRRVPGDGWSLERDSLWLGWAEPYVPRWMGYAICASWLFLALRYTLRRDGRGALLGVVAPLAAVLQASLSHGWFPGGLRHGLFSMTLCLLPVAGLVEALAELLSWPRAREAATLAVPTASVLAAAVARFECTPPLPIAAEYRLLRDTLATMAPDDHFVTLPGADLRRFLVQWVQTLRPDVRTVGLDELRQADHGTFWLVHDRLCFLDRECFRNPWLCSPRAPPRARPAGAAIADDCRLALAAKPWRPVRQSVLCAGSQAGDFSQPFDIPPGGRCATLRVYRWSAGR